MDNKDNYKDNYKHRSSKDGRKARVMVRVRDVDSSSAYSSSSSSSSKDEGDRRKNKKFEDHVLVRGPVDGRFLV
jgi:hypothetical protein